MSHNSTWLFQFWQDIAGNSPRRSPRRAAVPVRSPLWEWLCTSRGSPHGDADRNAYKKNWISSVAAFLCVNPALHCTLKASVLYVPCARACVDLSGGGFCQNKTLPPTQCHTHTGEKGHITCLSLVYHLFVTFYHFYRTKGVWQKKWWNVIKVWYYSDMFSRG